MIANLDNFSYGKVWQDFHCDVYRGYRSRMSDYHMHEYYEISLVTSGDLKILLPGLVKHCTGSCLLMIPPLTPHLILCNSSKVYSRTNLLFSKDFLDSCFSKEIKLCEAFGESGRIIPLNDEQTAEFCSLAHEMQIDKNLLRRKMRLLIFLSKTTERSIKEDDELEKLPSYIIGALSYIQEKYNAKIRAAELAAHLGVGRTTLMTGFKRYTGTTLNDYLLRFRLDRAIKYLEGGKSQSQVAEACGFGDSCNLCRSFKRYFGISPKEYLKKRSDGQGTLDIAKRSGL